MREYTLANIPTADEYVAGLRAIRDRMNDSQLRLLRSQYAAPHRTATSPQLAELADITGGHSVVNAHYGRLGHMFCDETGLDPDVRPDGTFRWWAVWSSGYSHPDGFLWVMHRQVATALEHLGWVDPKEDDSERQFGLQPSDIEPPPADRIAITTIRIVRDTTLARLIKDLHAHECQICGTTIELPDGSRYSEAHHIKPLGTPHNGPDVAENIIVLCPNHHAMCDYGVIHLQLPELRTHPEHEIGIEYVDYHNNLIRNPMIAK